uniref:DNAJC9 HTH domain-containing protein n=1 Tax=Oryctolagus cuniculus TaxID=9986 RepID=A0A5F9CBF2_RABIT
GDRADGGLRADPGDPGAAGCGPRAAPQVEFCAPAPARPAPFAVAVKRRCAAWSRPLRASCDAGALGYLSGKRQRPGGVASAGTPAVAAETACRSAWHSWSCARKCSGPLTSTRCWACGARPRTARSDAATTRCPCRCTRTGWARATRRTPPAAFRYAGPGPRRPAPQRLAGIPALGLRPGGGGRSGPGVPSPPPLAARSLRECRGECWVLVSPQILGRVYSVLSDKEQRAVYDEQGTVDEDATVLNQDRDWEAYWRLLFKKISLEDIQAFEKTYKGSEEELADIKQAYLDFKGDMDQIMESVLCVQYTEEPRIRNIIQQAIDAREVPSYKAFVKESKQKMNARKRRAQEEAKEAEVSRKELGLDEGVDNLKALIQSRQKDRQKEMDNFLAQMEAKYCKPSKGGGKKTALKKEKK